MINRWLILTLVAWAGTTLASPVLDSVESEVGSSQAPPQIRVQIKPKARHSNQTSSSSMSEERWQGLHPSRRIEFYGIRAEGSFVVFVIDQSSSMSERGRLLRAKEELRRAVDRFQSPQKYTLITFNDRTYVHGQGIPLTTSRGDQKRLPNILRTIEPVGGTNPLPAIRQAIGMQPDAIFLLADGKFAEDVPTNVGRMNARLLIPIHCVDLSRGEAGAGLRRIAKESGGGYTAR